MSEGKKIVFLTNLFLRIGLAFVLLYAAFASFLRPDLWEGYLPVILQRIIPANLLLEAFSVMEILLAAWLLSGKKTFYAASFAALVLFGIIVSNFGVMDIVFRDVDIFFSALTLAALSYTKKIT